MHRPHLHVVTVDTEAFVPPWHRGFYLAIREIGVKWRLASRRCPLQIAFHSGPSKGVPKRQKTLDVLLPALLQPYGWGLWTTLTAVPISHTECVLPYCFATSLQQAKCARWRTQCTISTVEPVKEIFMWLCCGDGACGSAVAWGTALHAGRSRVRFPMLSLEFFIDIILPAALWPWGGLSL